MLLSSLEKYILNPEEVYGKLFRKLKVLKTLNRAVHEVSIYLFQPMLATHQFLRQKVTVTYS